MLEGSWDVSFDPKRGGPEKVTFDTLEDCTRNEERGIKWESGLLGGREHKAGRYTFTTSPGPGKLFPSGLLGPVKLLRQPHPPEPGSTAR